MLGPQGELVLTLEAVSDICRKVSEMRTLSIALVIGLLVMASGCNQSGKEPAPDAAKAAEPAKVPQPAKTEPKPPAEKTDADVTREFEAIVELAKKSNAFDSAVTDVSYDVQKTNSLISPYTAVMSWTDKPDISVRAHFAYQKGRWGFTGGEHQMGKDHPWEDDYLFSVMAGSIAKDYYSPPPKK